MIPRAWFAGVLAEDLLEVSDDPAVLDGGGWWAVVATFEGRVGLWRFGSVRRAPLPVAGPWHGPGPHDWTSSLSRDGYLAGVREVRRRIREGDVYQVNLCRTLRAPLPPDADPWALAVVLASGNPAPFAAVLDLPGEPLDSGRIRVVSASPELFLDRDRDRLRSSPIKGTATTASRLLPKDEAENVMIVDLVRNDLQHVSRPGSVVVSALLDKEPHPGLVHLVSTVEGRLRPGISWPAVLAATFPPGSVSGAPKSSALRTITDLEPSPRGPYCGAIGWVDADRRRARLAVGIRTFWWQRDALTRAREAGLERLAQPGDELCFGTGAGITWGSDAAAEWAETELKASRLVGLASGGQTTGYGAARSAGREGR